MNFGKRRVCMFGEVHIPSTESCTKSAPLPHPMHELAQELVRQGVFPSETPPNHVLLNEYQPGQGIMPHTDGPIYKEHTATLSLVSSVVMEFTKRRQVGGQAIPSGSVGGRNSKARNDDPLQVLLESGSLLVFQDDAYINYCHGIAMDVWQDVTHRDRLLNASAVTTADGDVIVPRELRYSLTFRHKKWES